jgi:hypothetical protein
LSGHKRSKPVAVIKARDFLMCAEKNKDTAGASLRINAKTLKKPPNRLFLLIFFKKSLTGWGLIYNMRSHLQGTSQSK